jgi:hypothetical protein
LAHHVPCRSIYYPWWETNAPCTTRVFCSERDICSQLMYMLYTKTLGKDQKSICVLDSTWICTKATHVKGLACLTLTVSAEKGFLPWFSTSAAISRRNYNQWQGTHFIQAWGICSWTSCSACCDSLPICPLWPLLVQLTFKPLSECWSCVLKWMLVTLYM